MLQPLIPLYNPWWNNPDWRTEGIPREIFPQILHSVMKESYITIIKGARQCGKTFLIKQLITHLLKSGIHPQNIFYFLMDDPELANFIGEHPNEFGKYLRNEANSRGKLFVFLDEFQKVRTITNIVKLFYEFSTDIQFVMTGSSSLQVADKINESLMGRTKSFILSPFSLNEFLTSILPKQPFTLPLQDCLALIMQFFHKPDQYYSELKQYYHQYQFAFQMIMTDFLPRYLLTGGYPQAALVSNTQDSFLRLKEIKQAFVEKDIVNLLRIEKIQEFDKLLKILALQAGDLLNYNDLQTAVGINYQTLMHFFSILQNTYLWSLLPVYASNKISSIKKRPKSYFHDLGLRNLLAATYDSIQLQKEKGPIAENFVYNQLSKFNHLHLHGLGQLYFWRSPDGNEVDFMLEYGRQRIPIEVKYQQTAQIKISRGLQTFLKQEGFDFAIILTDNSLEMRGIDGIRYYLLPLCLLAGI